jgi:HAD superfamily hydrolase (TIGR01509 family)
MPRTAALVDLDGTLVDSNYLHALAWWRALRDAGHTVPVARVHKLIGMGADQLLRELLGEHDPELEARWTERFDELRPEVTVLPGAADLLRALSTRGITVVLATSGRSDDVQELRRRLQADEWISAEVNSSEVDTSKPEPDIFATALERAGTTADRAVVIGDTGWDIDAATRCGLPTIAVTTGGWSRPELTERGAIEVYDDVGALARNLECSWLSRLATR